VRSIEGFTLKESGGSSRSVFSFKFGQEKGSGTTAKDFLFSLPSSTGWAIIGDNDNF